MVETRRVAFRNLVRRAPSLGAEGAAIIVGAGAFLLVGIVGLLVFHGGQVPIAGPGSVAQYAAIAAGVIGLLTYLAGRLARRTGMTPFAVSSAGGAPGQVQADGGVEPGMPVAHRASPVDVFDTVVIALAHAVLLVLGWTVLGAILSDSFKDATVYWLAAAVLAGSAAAGSAYYVFLSAWNMDPMRLSTVLAVFAVVGIFTAMLTAPDPHWWMLHLSALGMTDSISSLAFNLTLIIAGIMVTAIARYATDARGITDPAVRASVVRVRVGLILMGVLLACVGIFPLDKAPTLHNVSAVGMVVMYALIVFWVKGAVPAAPASFIILGYVFFAVVVVMLVFFIIGYYVLTATELVAGLVIFSWLIVYLRVVGAAQAQNVALRSAHDDVVA
jgi:hypothetical membrane protein